MGDGGDAGQRFTSKPHGRHVVKLIGRVELACGVTLEGQRHFFRRDADAIINDPNVLDATDTDLDCNLGGASIYRVLDQFLYHRDRAFDHFPGGYLSSQGRRENPDRHGPPPLLG